jgi:hypothetical protein
VTSLCVRQAKNYMLVNVTTKVIRVITTLQEGWICLRKSHVRCNL